uniref:Schwannomin-interacting protein 1 n=2 Tax=Bactrocera dorsalis TaxID=27457 RepID=A0A034V843_BACDO
MRVPDITLTAGNAAQFTHNTNNPTTLQQQQLTTTTSPEESLRSLQPERKELNKNANWPVNGVNATSTGFFDYLPSAQFSDTSVYTSSADEFVQRALSSSLTVPYEYTNPALVGSRYEEYYQRTNPQTQNYLENYGGNSNSAYKGFQEVYVNRAAIALDDYEKINRATKFGNSNSVTSAVVQQSDNYSTRAVRDVSQSDYKNEMKNDIGITVNEPNSNHQQQVRPIASTEECSAGNANDSENYYNDQSMLDLCNERDLKLNVEQHNDELDEYLTSPTSSSVSLSTPQRFYFPRGIINPNYPGFQHLAHTLSEHFIGCTPSDSYDSDMSECEMELSADSCEELPSEEQQAELNTKLNIYNNNSNSNSNSSHKRAQVESQQYTDIAQQQWQRQQHQQQPNLIAYTDANSNSATTQHVSSDELQQQQQHQKEQHSKLGALIANELHDNLRQLLTLNVPDNYSDAYIINSADNFAFRCDQKCRLVAQISDERQQVYGTTPDILLKNSNLRVEELSKKENRPDLLRGVSPQPLRKRTEMAFEDFNQIERPDNSVEKLELERKEVQKYVPSERRSNATTPVRSHDNGKEDGVGFGITPVDIIGDFEQEVEREFGLLVSGYRRLVETNDEANEDDNEVGQPQPIEKVSDAMLSSAKDLIDSDKYVTALQQNKEEETTEVEAKAETETANKSGGQDPTMDFMEDNNAVDWSYGRCGDSEEINACPAKELECNSQRERDDVTDVSTVSNTSSAQMRPKYQKASYDERQLPPVAIEYKRCQQNSRNMRKSAGQNHEKSEKPTKASGGTKIGRNYSKTGFTSRFFSSKRTNMGGSSRNSEENSNRRREEAEMHQYQQLISNKELILSNSRYTKMSAWAEYLKNSVKNHGGKCASTDLASPSALDLFDAYKIGGDFDMETLQQHLKLAKEIEKKRRSDREEIRRRLAMGSEEPNQESKERNAWKTGIQSRLANAQLGRLNDPSSDTESHSSDSETCPKLSKGRQVDNMCALNISLADKPTYPYAGSGHASISSLSSAATANKYQIQQQMQRSHSKQQSFQTPMSAFSSEDLECDFFTKQAKLQIEARMALAQAKEMAHMQMEIERQNRRVSPITDIIRVSLRKVGVQMTADKRRVSRQMLTDMNIAQLQILVNSLHTHIEELNESLVHNLMERDDLHVSQDSMLVDIEELTRYIGANEHLAQRYKNQNHN